MPFTACVRACFGGGRELGVWITQIHDSDFYFIFMKALPLFFLFWFYVRGAVISLLQHLYIHTPSSRWTWFSLLYRIERQISCGEPSSLSSSSSGKHRRHFFLLFFLGLVIQGIRSAFYVCTAKLGTLTVILFFSLSSILLHMYIYIYQVGFMYILLVLCIYELSMGEVKFMLNCFSERDIIMLCM